MATYSIEALAKAAGTTVRNVRAYREKGLLPSPQRKGRRAIYNDGHLVRLKLITNLLKRGLPTKVIKDLVSGWEQGEDVADLLGLEEALVGAAGPGDELPAWLSRDDLRGLFARDPDERQIQRAVDLGFLEPDSDGWKVNAPRLLRVGSELTDEGMSLDAVLDLANELRVRIRELSEAFIEIVWDAMIEPRLAGLSLDDPDIKDLIELIGRLRPLAKIAVDAELATAIQEGIDRRLPEVGRLLLNPEKT